MHQVLIELLNSDLQCSVLDDRFFCSQWHLLFA